MASSQWTTSSDQFQVGDQVWPVSDGPMAFQQAPQTVIAIASHPLYGEWLWLDDGHGGLRTFGAEPWTTTQPSKEEIADRESQLLKRLQENEAMWVNADITRHWCYDVI